MTRVATHAIRIIAGRWRGTRIAVADRAQLRPTADRVRETLFNWLAPELAGARCLDLFAGTGALGFEALSRGAAGCCLVERDALLVASMQGLKARLGADDADIQQADVLSWLGRTATPYDIIFLDPPFHAALVSAVLSRLAHGWLAPRALLYVECEREARFEFGTLMPHRESNTQHVRYMLLRQPALD